MDDKRKLTKMKKHLRALDAYYKGKTLISCFTRGINAGSKSVMMRFGLNYWPITSAFSLIPSNNSVYVMPRRFGGKQNATGSFATQEYEYKH